MAKTLTLTHLFNMPSDAKARVAGKTFVGIDFGTSTTVVSVASLDENGKIRSECLHLAQRGADGAMIEAELLPTVIAINDRNKLIVGKGAYSLKGNPDYIFGENIWYQFKMELGKDLGPRWFNSRQAKIKCPQDATKLFFRYLKKCIEDTCKANGFSADIQYAVSIPASFESNQRKDLLEALEANDMCVTNSMLIDEPNAAFISYISHDYEAKQINLQEGRIPKVLVFDFGAGTCDISVLEIAVSTSGITTKNISISQFQELGGSDIDRFIAWNILLPELLKHNGKKEEDYTTRQLEVIVNQLLGIAEKLKVQACRAFHFFLSDKDSYHSLVETGEQSVKVNVDLCINTDVGDLVQRTFHLGYKQFITTMDAFLGKSKTVIKYQKPYNSINETLVSALTKAHAEASDIDYVIMVGGSSKNPFIQEYIKKYFAKEVLIGEDIQSLVSEGAAIHSLLLNGLDIAVVRPITSEAIVVITNGIHAYPIIPAGTEIPFTPVKFDGLTTGSAPKSIVEIPICVNNEKKMLVNAKIESKDELPFPADTPIELTFEMTADKLLKVSASKDFHQLDSIYAPLLKGGTYRKWYGNMDLVAKYDETTLEHMKQYRNFVLKSEEYYFKEGLTWTLELHNGYLNIRYMPKGVIFSNRGAAAFGRNTYDSLKLLGFLSGKVTAYFFNILSPTLSISAGTFNRIPVKQMERWNTTLVEQNISLSKADWDSHETSWDFQRNPLWEQQLTGILINMQELGVMSDDATIDDIEAFHLPHMMQPLEVLMENYKSEWEDHFMQLHANEEELNRQFISIYGLEDELTPDVPLSEITILQQGEINVEDDTLKWNDDVIIKQLISYAVGCMLGRYRLDKPGLHIAHPNPTDEETAPYTIGGEQWDIDDDGIMPLMASDCGFSDNATVRFADFIRVTMGADHLVTNLNYVEQCLGKTLEQYFIKDFWKDHKKMYQNRPIYWLFASRKGTFQVIAYMHRMNAYTVERIRAKYLLPFIEHLETEIGKLDMRRAELSTKETKQIQTLQKQLDECREYHERLQVVAEQAISFDLDDGVVVNHAKFGDVVTKLK